MAYHPLTERERFYIEQRLSLGESIPEIAKALGRHKTSLYREIKRNTDPIEPLRQEAGHFEADTIFGVDQKSFLLTLVDLATKYTIIVKLENKEANTVYIALKYIVDSSLIPFRSITSDNGGEFALHEMLKKHFYLLVFLRLLLLMATRLK